MDEFDAYDDAAGYDTAVGYGGGGYHDEYDGGHGDDLGMVTHAQHADEGDGTLPLHPELDLLMDDDFYRAQQLSNLSEGARLVRLNGNSKFGRSTGVLTAERSIDTLSHVKSIIEKFLLTPAKALQSEEVTLSIPRKDADNEPPHVVRTSFSLRDIPPISDDVHDLLVARNALLIPRQEERPSEGDTAGGQNGGTTAPPHGQEGVSQLVDHGQHHGGVAIDQFDGCHQNEASDGIGGADVVADDPFLPWLGDDNNGDGFLDEGDELLFSTAEDNEEHPAEDMGNGGEEVPKASSTKQNQQQSSRNRGPKMSARKERSLNTTHNFVAKHNISAVAYAYRLVAAVRFGFLIPVTYLNALLRKANPRLSLFPDVEALVLAASPPASSLAANNSGAHQQTAAASFHLPTSLADRVSFIHAKELVYNHPTFNAMRSIASAYLELADGTTASAAEALMTTLTSPTAQNPSLGGGMAKDDRVKTLSFPGMGMERFESDMSANSAFMMGTPQGSAIYNFHTAIEAVLLAAASASNVPSPTSSRGQQHGGSPRSFKSYCETIVTTWEGILTGTPGCATTTITNLLHQQLPPQHAEVVDEVMCTFGWRDISLTSMAVGLRLWFSDIAAASAVPVDSAGDTPSFVRLLPNFKLFFAPCAEASDLSKKKEQFEKMRSTVIRWVEILGVSCGLLPLSPKTLSFRTCLTRLHQCTNMMLLIMELCFTTTTGDDEWVVWLLSMMEKVCRVDAAVGRKRRRNHLELVESESEVEEMPASHPHHQKPKAAPKVSTTTCRYCGTNQRSARRLTKHILTVHRAVVAKERQDAASAAGRNPNASQVHAIAPLPSTAGKSVLVEPRVRLVHNVPLPSCPPPIVSTAYVNQMHSLHYSALLAAKSLPNTAVSSTKRTSSSHVKKTVVDSFLFKFFSSYLANKEQTVGQEDGVTNDYHHHLLLLAAQAFEAEFLRSTEEEHNNNSTSSSSPFLDPQSPAAWQLQKLLQTHFEELRFVPREAVPHWVQRKMIRHGWVRALGTKNDDGNEILQKEGGENALVSMDHGEELQNQNFVAQSSSSPTAAARASSWMFIEGSFDLGCSDGDEDGVVDAYVCSTPLRKLREKFGDHAKR